MPATKLLVQHSNMALGALPDIDLESLKHLHLASRNLRNSHTRLLTSHSGQAEAVVCMRHNDIAA